MPTSGATILKLRPSFSSEGVKNPIFRRLQGTWGNLVQEQDILQMFEIIFAMSSLIKPYITHTLLHMMVLQLQIYYSSLARTGIQYKL